MDIEILKKKVREILIQMECTGIAFSELKENLIAVTFNCKNLTSFKADLLGWTYSGIHLDPTHKHQYKIDFLKNK